MIGEYSEIKNMPNTFACKFVAGLNGDLRVELADKFLNKQVISVFKDEELKNSIDAFLLASFTS